MLYSLWLHKYIIIENFSVIENVVCRKLSILKQILIELVLGMFKKYLFKNVK